MAIPTTGMGTNLDGKVVRRVIIKKSGRTRLFWGSCSDSLIVESHSDQPYTLSDRPQTAETMSHGHPDLQDGHTNSQDECDVRYTPHSAVVTNYY